MPLPAIDEPRVPAPDARTGPTRARGRRADARAAVVDPQPRHAVLARRADAPLPGPRAVLDRVVEQVEEHLSHRAGIGGHDQVLRHRRGHLGATGRGDGREAVDHLLNQRSERGGLGPMWAVCRSEREKCSSSRRGASAGGLPESMMASERRRSSSDRTRPSVSVSEKHPDLGERGAELVRNAGNEVGAQARELRLAPQLK